MKNRISLLIIIILINGFNLFTNAQTTVESGFTFEGLNRTYRLYVPSGYNSQQAVPLLLNLHGYGSNNIEQEQYGDFRPIADTAVFLVVHPNGTLDFNNTMHWNTFGTSNVNDVGFLSALIDTLAQHYNIDLSRVYSTGMSNGGFMSYSLSCALSQKIAAIASVTGTMTTANFMTCLPSRPIPMMHIHGTADATVPYNGNAFFVPVVNIVDYWIDHNNCQTTAEFQQLPDINPNDGCTAERYVYPMGDAGTSVEHYKIIGGGHSWPGAPININITNMDFSASEVIWQFLRKYDMTGLMSSSDEMESSAFQIGPNPSNGWVTLTSTSVNPMKITVYDALGKIQSTYNTEDLSTKIQLKSSGLNYIQVSSKSLTKTYKVVNIQ